MLNTSLMARLMAIGATIAMNDEISMAIRRANNKECGMESGKTCGKTMCVVPNCVVVLFVARPAESRHVH